MAEIEIRYLGNSAFELTTEKGIHILIDPCLTGFKNYKGSPVKLSELAPVDLILISHAAGDHLGDTLAISREHHCRIVCDPVIEHYLQQEGVPEEDIRSVSWGAGFDFKGISIRIVEAHHSSVIIKDGAVLTGAPLGFILNTESGTGIYHAGDTSIFRDLELFGQLYKPDIGMLPIGAFPPFEPDLFPEEAALVAKWMKLKIAIPMHFPPDSDEGEKFAAAVKKEAPGTSALVLKPGEKFNYQTR